MHHPYLDALFQFEAGWHAVVRTAFTTRAVELIEQWQERAVGLMSHSKVWSWSRRATRRPKALDSATRGAMTLSLLIC